MASPASKSCRPRRWNLSPSNRVEPEPGPCEALPGAEVLWAGWTTALPDVTIEKEAMQLDRSPAGSSVRSTSRHALVNGGRHAADQQRQCVHARRPEGHDSRADIRWRR